MDILLPFYLDKDPKKIQASALSFFLFSLPAFLKGYTTPVSCDSSLPTQCLVGYIMAFATPTFLKLLAQRLPTASTRLQNPMASFCLWFQVSVWHSSSWFSTWRYCFLDFPSFQRPSLFLGFWTPSTIFKASSSRSNLSHPTIFLFFVPLSHLFMTTVWKVSPLLSTHILD